MSLTAYAQADILSSIDELTDADRRKLEEMARKYNIRHYVHQLREARKDRDKQLDNLRSQQQVGQHGTNNYLNNNQITETSC